MSAIEDRNMPDMLSLLLFAGRYLDVLQVPFLGGILLAVLLDREGRQMRRPIRLTGELKGVACWRRRLPMGSVLWCCW